MRLLFVAAGHLTVYGGWCTQSCQAAGKHVQVPAPSNLVSQGWLQSDEGAPGFGFANPATLPPPPADVPLRFVQLGGQDVKVGKFPPPANFSNYVFQPWATPYNCGHDGPWQQPCGMGLGGDYNGLDFDMEDLLYTQSGLPGSLDGAVDWLTQVRQYAADNGKGKVYAMLTILGNPYNSAENFAVKVETVKQNLAHFDYVALMLYGGSMGACGGAEPSKEQYVPCGDWCLPDRAGPADLDATPTSHCLEKSAVDGTAGNAAAGCGTLGYLKPWLDAGLPPEKIVLGMTTAGCSQHMVDLFTDIAKQKGLGGILFWKVANAEPYLAGIKQALSPSVLTV